MTQNLKTEQAMRDAIAKFKEQEVREREKLDKMPQKEFADLCNDLGIFGGSKRSRIEQVMQKMVFCR